MFEIVEQWLRGQGLEEPLLRYVSWGVVTVGTIILAYLANLVTRRILLTALSILIRRTRTDWDDALLERRVLHRAAHAAPAMVFYWLAPAFKGAETTIEHLALVYLIAVGGAALSAFLNAFVDVYQKLPVATNRPIKGFVQLAQIILAVFLVVISVAILINQSPIGVLGGLGAMTAVLILVFKDTILGLVASFQISTLDMVRVGDWIEMPKFGADGSVIDISLHTVKVQNWDKTISTIPTYSLISDSFKNWRGMSESGGRRIKRSINIDMTTVRFCDREMIERFSKFEYISEYIRQKKEELSKYNEERKVDTTYLVNGRHMTNLGTFRAYVAAYLKNHPMVHEEMTFLVRHLQPGEHGLPLQIYVFSKDQRWAYYESIQADIFDHILAVVPLFDLRVFQEPSGADVGRLAETLSESISTDKPGEST